MHVVPVVTEFLRIYPDIDIRLTLADRMLHLQDDHVDLALRIGTLPDSSLKAVRVGAVRRVVCASPGYLARHGTPMQPADLGQHQCVTFTGLMTAERWVFPVSYTHLDVYKRQRIIRSAIGLPGGCSRGTS